MKLRLVSLIPLSIVCIIMVFTWINILSTDYFATWKHQVALVLVGINLVLLYFNFRYGILFMGLILLLATFDVIGFFTSIESTKYYIGFGSMEVQTPFIQSKSLLLLLLYVVVNFKTIRTIFDD